MAKLRHIAIIVPDPEQAAQFFEKAFGMQRASIARRGITVSDGTVNVALLAKETPEEEIGIAHFGMWVDELDAAEKKVVDAGATMVVSNHPHVIQGMAVYKGVPIVYSVGNFIFDQMFSVQVREGSVLEMVIRGGKVVGLRPRGVEIEDFNQPRLMSLGEHASQMDRFWDAADRIAARG